MSGDEFCVINNCKVRIILKGEHCNKHWLCAINDNDYDNGSLARNVFNKALIRALNACIIFLIPHSREMRFTSRLREGRREREREEGEKKIKKRCPWRGSGLRRNQMTRTEGIEFEKNTMDTRSMGLFNHGKKFRVY